MKELKWDRARFLREIDYDLETAQELISLFLSSSSLLLEAMEKALSENDFSLLSEKAHSLKGAAATLFLEEIRQEALALERERQPEHALRRLSRLRALCEIFQKQIEERPLSKVLGV